MSQTRTQIGNLARRSILKTLRQPSTVRGISTVRKMAEKYGS